MIFFSIPLKINKETVKTKSPDASLTLMSETITQMCCDKRKKKKTV